MKPLLIAFLLSLSMIAGHVEAKPTKHPTVKTSVVKGKIIKTKAKKAKVIIDSSIKPTRSVTAAIRKASHATGVSSNVLAGYVSLESNFKANARNPKGAKGLVQITPATFRYLARTYGDNYGIARANPNNPYHSAVLAGAYIQENRQILRDGLGREPTDEECYLAYFISPQKAVKVIHAPPRKDAVRMLGSIAYSHKKYFFSGRKHNTVSEFRSAVYRDFRKHVDIGEVAMRQQVNKPVLIADLSRPHPYVQ